MKGILTGRTPSEMAAATDDERAAWLDAFLVQGEAFKLVRETLRWMCAKRTTSDVEGGDAWSDAVTRNCPGHLHWVVALDTLMSGRAYVPDLDLRTALVESDIHAVLRSFSGGQFAGNPYFTDASDQLLNTLASVDFVDTVRWSLQLTSRIIEVPEEHHPRVVLMAEQVFPATLAWFDANSIASPERGRAWSWLSEEERGIDWEDGRFPIHNSLSANVLRTLAALYERRGKSDRVHRALVAAGWDYDHHMERVREAVDHLIASRESDGGWQDFAPTGLRRADGHLSSETSDPAVTAEVLWGLTVAARSADFLLDGGNDDGVREGIRGAATRVVREVVRRRARSREFVAALTCQLELIHKPVLRFALGGSVHAAFAGLMLAAELIGGDEGAQHRVVGRMLFQDVIRDVCWGGFPGSGFRSFDIGGTPGSLALLESARAVEALLSVGLARDAGRTLHDIVTERLRDVADKVVLDLHALYEPYEHAGIRIAWGQIRNNAEELLRARGPADVATPADDRAELNDCEEPFVPTADFMRAVQRVFTLIDAYALDESVARRLAVAHSESIPPDHRGQIRQFLDRANGDRFRELLKDLASLPGQKATVARATLFRRDDCTARADGHAYDLLYAPLSEWLDRWCATEAATLADARLRLAALEEALASLQRGMRVALDDPSEEPE